MKWPNGARVAVWVVPNFERCEFDIRSVGHQRFNLIPNIINSGWRDHGPGGWGWRPMDTLDNYGMRWQRESEFCGTRQV